MASDRTDTAVASQRQAHRSAPRIVPAIPRRFARPPVSSRPITPDESTTAAVTQRVSEPQSVTKETDARASTPVQDPLTPDSKASALNSGEVEETVLASSPAHSEDDFEEAQDTRVSEALTHDGTARNASLSPHPTPETAAVDGDRPKAMAPDELPPEFHPQEKPTVQQPTLKGTETSLYPPADDAHLHRPQPSVEDLVFGGTVQESPAMPSTPQELEPEVPPPQQTFSRPPRGFAPPHLAPQFFPGHSHHPSDPATTFLYPTYSMAPPPDAVYTNGHEFHSTSFSAASSGYQAPYPALHTMNDAMRSHSQSPSKSQRGDIKPSSNYDEEPQSIPYANGFASHHRHHHHDASHDGYDITKHIFGLLGNPEFTDYILHIHSQETMLLTLPIHAAIVSRSPVIFEALRRSAPSAYRAKDPRRLADILVTNDKFVTTEALHEAIKILYGAPLLPVQSFLYGLSPYDSASEQNYVFSDARKRMSQAISYAAAGRVLQIPEMQACGLRIAKALLRWDTLDQALHFGLSAGTTTVQPSGAGADRRLLETYAVPLLDDAIEFIAYNFPADFPLYTLAPEMRQNPRLPTLPEFRQPSHNPRLSKIRFGDAPPEDDLKPSYVTQTLSSILLSLPPALLDRLFSHPAAANQVGWSGLVKILRDVVEEREKRRERAIKAQPGPDTNVPRGLLENVYREERVDVSPDRPSGYKLTSTRLPSQV